MFNLVKSEVLKMRSTQVWIWMLLLSFTLTTLVTWGASYALTSTAQADSDTPTFYDVFTVFRGEVGPPVALFVLGVLGYTTEFRHKTITPTLLATANRWKVTGGKAAAYFVFAVVYAAVCVAVNFGFAVVWFDAHNITVNYDHIAMGVFKGFVSLAWWGLFGLAIGAVIRVQAAAMVIGLIYIVVIGNIMQGVPYVRRVYPYSPQGAVRSFVSDSTPDGPFKDVHMLSPTLGGVVMVLWVVGLLVLSTELLLRRDIS